MAANSKPSPTGRHAVRATRPGPRRRERREPRFEIDRRILLRALLLVVVLAFLALFIRVASIGFGGSVRSVDRADRQMQRPDPADSAR